MCQEHQNTVKPYIFAHDPKFIDLCDRLNEEVTI